MIFSKNCATLMRALLKLSRLVRTLIIDSIKLFLRNLINLLMIDLLGLSLSDNERAKQLFYALDGHV
jgi:putative exporter of polyketide antibiotics